jgi:broad specificity phosphatase PhoE
MDFFPEKIFFVRHTERADHKDPYWGRKGDRPHDPGITAEGKGLCHKLAKYLVGARRVAPGNVVILTSPLQRCVQTSHCIAEGLAAASAGRLPIESIPVYVEPGLVESVYWLHNDIRRNRSFVDEKYPPRPIYLPTDWLYRNVSFLVKRERFGLCEDPVYGLDEKGLLSEAVPVQVRCQRAAHTLVSSGLFSGKVVICVGHSETCREWFNALSAEPCPSHPLPFTAVAELMPAPVADRGRACVVWHPQIPPFHTPHLGTEENRSLHAEKGSPPLATPAIAGQMTDIGVRRDPKSVSAGRRSSSVSPNAANVRRADELRRNSRALFSAESSDGQRRTLLPSDEAIEASLGQWANVTGLRRPSGADDDPDEDD